MGYGGSTLPSALLLHGNRLRDEGNIEAARETLLEGQRLAAVCPDAATLSEAIENALGALEIDAAVRAEDAQAIRRTCEHLLGLSQNRRVPFAPLVHGARFLLNLDLPAEELAGVLEAIVLLAETYLSGENLDPGARRFIASHAGNLARVLAHHDSSVRAARRVHELYRCALDAPAGAAAPELYAFVGDSALQLGRRLLAAGEDPEAAGFLEDACEALSAAIEAATNPETTPSASFRLVVSHSKLGEAALRLNALTGTQRWLEIAITEFERSRELGNDSPELKGLLADVYFRRGRIRGDVDDLMRCVMLKEEARLAGGVSRENLSISARVHFQLGAIRRDIAQQRQGVSLLAQALLADPDWPCPLFQLPTL